MRTLITFVCFWLLLATRIYGQSPTVFFRTDCTPHISVQACCWDTDSFTLSCGNGTSLVRIPGMTGTGTPNALARFNTTGNLDASPLQVDSVTGNVALRTTPSTYGLYLFDGPNTAGVDIMMEQYSNSNNGTLITKRRARGTESAPEKMQLNDIIAGTVAASWSRDAANTTDTWVTIGNTRFSIEAIDAESRVGSRYDIHLTSGASAAILPKLRVTANGSLMIANQVTGSPTAQLDIFGSTMRLRTAKTPATSTEACDSGTIAWDTGFVYVCTATNTWKRAALTTW